MPIDVMVKEATGLPDKYVDMAVSYIQYLQFQFDNETKKQNKTKRQIGILADKFHSISDDFDETPDVFEDYI